MQLPIHKLSSYPSLLNSEISNQKLPRIHLPTPESTERLGMILAGLAKPGDVIALIGDLGAGKTQLVRGMAKALGIPTAQVSSPTYVFVHEYEPPPKADPENPVLVHIDAYRIESVDAFRATVWGEDGRDLREDAIVAIEWANLVEAALPADCIKVTLEHAENGRTATIQGSAHLESRLTSLG